MKISERIASKQKKLFLSLIVVVLGAAAALVFISGDDDEPSEQKQTLRKEDRLQLISDEIDPNVVRLSTLEQENSALNERLDFLEKNLSSLDQEKSIFVQENQKVLKEAEKLNDKIETLQEEFKKENDAVKASIEEKKKGDSQRLTSWEQPGKKDGRHVLFEIPAGTVLKAILISGADCSVAVQKPTGPNMVLLRPIDNGQLPRKVRVPLKGSVLIGNAIGDLSTERVYIRAERMTLVERNGDFIETEVTGYISGEDGREGMRGVVVDRSGQIITRAAFAALLQGIGQGVESAFNADAIGKIANNQNQKGYSFDALRQISQSSAAHGGAAALGKMADYYIKRAEQLQPAIQIAAGRVVDVVFTKSVKIGEKDLKKKFAQQRAAKRDE